MNVLTRAIETVRRTEPIELAGSVASLRGLTLLVDALPATVGSIVTVHTRGADGGHRPGEVVGFEGHRAIVMMLAASAGIRPGDRVTSDQPAPTVAVGESMLGRVIDGLGQPIDGGAALHDLTPMPMQPPPVGALERERISTMLPTGVRAIDLFTTVGKGQRLGIFAGPGVGKSTLLGMIARRTSADVNVMALIGERGREVREFIEESLGPEGLARTVMIVSTSDEAPLLRVRAAFVACAVAEYFRDQGQDVMLMLDSLTRFAHAQRQIGLSIGEPPATKGYTPSVFALLPALLERAGVTKLGSITGFYTILVEGDDVTEPVSDAVRGILDGHVMLDRKLANRGHFPSIDVLDSVSRVAPLIIDKEHEQSRRCLISLLAAHAEIEDLLQIGAYAAGSNPRADVAIALRDRIDALLQQGVNETAGFFNAKADLLELGREAQGLLAAAKSLDRSVPKAGTPGVPGVPGAPAASRA